MSSITKILYVHGLESGPVGTKTIALNKSRQFEVYAEDMHMSRYNIQKKNSMIRNALRQQIVPLIGCGILSIAAIRGIYPQFIVPSIGLYFGGCYYFKDEIFKSALKQSLEQCIDIQISAINKYKPDLIIGSSWGGNVTMELLKRNLWNGPTILLCPAYYGYQRYVNFDSNKETFEEFEERILNLGLENKNKKQLLVHGDMDEVVSLDDSKAIYEYNKDSFDLMVIPNDNHRLMGLTTSGKICDIVSDYMNQ